MLKQIKLTHKNGRETKEYIEFKKFLKEKPPTKIVNITKKDHNLIEVEIYDYRQS